MNAFQKEILGAIRYSRRLPEQAFNRLALETYRRQVVLNPVYRRCCGIFAEGDAVRNWRDIPALPASAFKYHRVRCFGRRAVRVFTTSGTTPGGRKGRHAYGDLGFYDAAVRSLFGPAVLGGNRRLRVASLVASPQLAPHSSLSYMAGRAARDFAKGKVLWACSKKGVCHERLASFLGERALSRQAVLVFSTTLALDGFLTFCERKGLRFALAAGSRIMETGGSKGRRRRISRPTLLKRAHKILGVPPGRVINEYGMTELTSQFYDLSPRGVKGIPSWCRILIVDPRNRRPVRKGRRGLIRILDLANQDSCAMIQTEDEGRLAGRGFEILGRRKGEDLRGCSLAYE